MRKSSEGRQIRKSAKRLLNGQSKEIVLLKKYRIRLTDKYANELKNYQLVCYYCGVMLDPINVNKKCKANLEQVQADCN